MIKLSRLSAIALSVAILFCATTLPTLSQTPREDLKHPSNRTDARGDALFTYLSPQTRVNGRVAPSLMPVTSYTNARESVFSLPTTAVPTAVTGSGTPGRLSKWSGISGSSTFVLGDSMIFEDKFGRVGIGTDSPTSKLTVAGVIESTTGGFKFPDGSVQTSSAAGALFSVAHDATLVGSGTVTSPLGVAPTFVSALTGEPFQQQVNITIPNNALSGTASITVPSNKRLVIEFVSGYCELFSPGFLLDRFQISTSLGGQTTSYQFAAVRTETGGIDHYVANQQVVIHADPGSTITLGISFPSMLPNGAVGRTSIAGHLFDAP